MLDIIARVSFKENFIIQHFEVHCLKLKYKKFYNSLINRIIYKKYNIYNIILHNII